jgi:hypothetical protein
MFVNTMGRKENTGSYKLHFSIQQPERGYCVLVTTRQNVYSYSCIEVMTRDKKHRLNNVYEADQQFPEKFVDECTLKIGYNYESHAYFLKPVKERSIRFCKKPASIN